MSIYTYWKRSFIAGDEISPEDYDAGVEAEWDAADDAYDRAYD